MRTKLSIVVILFLSTCFYQNSFAQGNSKKTKDLKLFREVPVLHPVKTMEKDTVVKKSKFKPSIQVGSIVHMFGSYEQSGFGPGGGAARETNNADSWSKGFSLYRARILVGGKLTKNGSFFLETDIPSIIGTSNADGEKNVKVAPIILDAQYEHTFGNHMVIAGLQLVSHNRNGLQGAAGLMANDFTYFQYPYNLFASQPLQGNFGRDLGINVRGFFLKDKLEYRFGMFTGRNTGVAKDPPLRYVGRVVYNFLDAEKDYYYAGTKLGAGKTIALGGGFDTQSSYTNFGIDLFMDLPAGNAGSITLNAAFSALNGGTDTDSPNSFATLIPKQTTQFLELGYYFKSVKLQPWIRYERQGIDADGLVQTGGVDVSAFNNLNTATVLGGGLNYWFAGYNTNLRLSYTTWNQENSLGKSDTYGQIWLQTQFFIF